MTFNIYNAAEVPLFDGIPLSLSWREIKTQKSSYSARKQIPCSSEVWTGWFCSEAEWTNEELPKQKKVSSAQTSAALSPADSTVAEWSPAALVLGVKWWGPHTLPFLWLENVSQYCCEVLKWQNRAKLSLALLFHRVIAHIVFKARNKNLPRPGFSMSGA